MRCEEKSGFLMLRKCENVAETECVYCRKKLCSEHTYAVTPEQAAKLRPTGAGQKLVACLQCFRQYREAGQPVDQQQQQQQQSPQPGRMPGQQGGYNRDPYYDYPYYGGYHPFFWGTGYSDHDRRVFDQQGSSSAGETEPGVLDS